MRIGLLGAAIAAGLVAPQLSARSGASDVDAGVATYIVHFSEPALALYRGPQPGDDPKRAKLQATSPAVTGAQQLDVQTKAAREYRDYLAEQRERRLAVAEQRLGRTLSPGFVYDVVANAVSLELSRSEAEQLAKLPGVRRVNREFERRLLTDAGPRWIGADRLWDGSLGVAATRGEGVVVGVIDSGFNATHPAFAERGPVDGFVHANPRGQLYGLCATTPGVCNNKLIGLYDFSICTGVHASANCRNREADNGLDVDGHGSHVASTVVGNTLTISFNLPTGSMQRSLSGVAPHANLIGYKACEDVPEGETTGGCRSSWLLAALNQAAIDRVQVLNYSIGAEAVDSPWVCFGIDCDGDNDRSDVDEDAEAMFALREAGTVVVVAAGNEGPGAGTVGSPAYSPWVLAVARTSHDRLVANRLVDLSGGATAPPSGGILAGAGLTAGFGPVALTVPNDFPLCSQGTELDGNATGLSNPWQPGRFNGEIVVCRRGVQARVAKSANVRLAGGGGMVLINQAADGEGIVADNHSIPSTHLGFIDGQALVTWLSSGSGHRGRLEGTTITSSPARADVLASSSSRGPIAFGDYLKPDVAAPGSDINAAAGTGNNFASLSGTSMASPHVAGAAALLRAARPSWTVTDIESALRSTAAPVVRMPDGVTPASAFDQGSGRIDLVAALRAGLSFPISGSDFTNANPANGGNPKTLNLPSLLDSRCRESCTFSRRVTDLVGGGSWRAEVSAPTGATISVSPAEFTLNPGGSANLQFTVNITDPRLIGSWVEGRVRLRRQAGSAPANVLASDTSLPVRVFAYPGDLPARINLNGNAARGFNDVLINDLVALSDLRYAATRLAVPTLTSQNHLQDPTNNTPYDNFGTGTFFTLVDVPTPAPGQTLQLKVDAFSPTAVDVDLFVGRDTDADGLPEESELLCDSTSPVAIEQCQISIRGASQAGRYWALAQNWRASTAGNDRIDLETAVIDLATDNGGNLVATGPATLPRQTPLALRMAWDDLTLQPGERRVGYVRVTANGGATPLGLIPVNLTRGSNAVETAKVLTPGSRTRLRLAPTQAQERLIIEIPANASELVVRSSGSGEVDLYAARVDSTSGPAIAAAPDRGLASARTSTAGANDELRVTGSALRAGRWYVTPVNIGSSTAEVDLEVAVSYATARPTVRNGAYFNPNRSGAGAFLFDVGNSWGFVWYTYDQDGSPTWYLGAAPRPDANQGIWNVSLSRFSWNGSAASATVVGSAALTLNSADNIQFAWNLDGQSGSERYVFIDSGACPTQAGAALDLNGFWYDPARSGFGYSVLAFAGGEVNSAYFYDSQGRGRWANAEVSPFGGTVLNFALRRGSCPTCDYAAPTVTSAIGTLTRSYSDARNGRMSVDLTLPAPLSGRWQVDSPVQKLSNNAGCP